MGPADLAHEVFTERGNMVCGIVVMRPGALGDALLSLPALASLRSAWPHARITLIARTDILALVQANQLADAVYPFDLPSWATLWGEAGRADALLVETMSHADVLIAWIGDADGVVRRNATTLGARRLVTAPGRPAANEHAAVYLLRTLAPLGLDAVAASSSDLAAHLPPLQPSPTAVVSAAQRWSDLGLGRDAVVALHVGSGAADKCWPPANFAALAGLIRASGRQPLLIEGPSDARPVRALLDALPPSQTLPVLRQMSIEEVAAALVRCAAYVGNDSGVAHLAAQLAVPTLALFGPSDPARWAPVGRHVRVLRADEAGVAPMSGLTVERVWLQLGRMLHDSDAAPTRE